ncbi:hypothetical protein [Marinomonas sp.]|uniref:hypothetical protein n=1 Tax=Marinomonas sp. TaxID=1904862 RepID=UPI003A94449A
MSFSRHAIQMDVIRVPELSIRVNRDSGDSVVQSVSENEFVMKFGHSEFDDESNQIGVGVIIDIGNIDASETSEFEFDLRVRVEATFSVDTKTFPVDKLDHWASFNAPLIIYPYLREEVYSLTSRALRSPKLLPLLELPTIKI